jgi:hypothetical protein
VGEIKVTDRRMFTPDGRLREEFERELENPSPADASPEPAAPAREPATVTAAPEAPPAPSPPASVPPLPLTGPPGQRPPAGLLELIQILGELSLACLGDVPQPDGRLLRDLDGARFYIDLVASLLERFGPGLGAEDRRALESFLDQIRLRYVSRSS